MYFSNNFFLTPCLAEYNFHSLLKRINFSKAETDSKLLFTEKSPLIFLMDQGILISKSLSGSIFYVPLSKLKKKKTPEVYKV